MADDRLADDRLAEQAEQKVRLWEKCHSVWEAVRAECHAMNPEALPMEQQWAEQAYEALQQRINATER